MHDGTIEVESITGKAVVLKFPAIEININPEHVVFISQQIHLKL